MKQFLSFVRKEFLHIFRDRQTLVILLGMPLVQILIFGFALTNEVKNARFAVVDHARDNASAQLIEQINASRYFDLNRDLHNDEQVEDAFRKGEIKLALIIPPSFGSDLQHLNHSMVQLIADAADPNTATTLSNYASVIIHDYQQRITDNADLPYTIQVQQRMLYN